jgi:hypothetical protein
MQVGRCLLRLSEAEGTYQQNQQDKVSHFVVKISRFGRTFPINFCGRTNTATDTYYRWSGSFPATERDMGYPSLSLRERAVSVLSTSVTKQTGDMVYSEA